MYTCVFKLKQLGWEGGGARHLFYILFVNKIIGAIIMVDDNRNSLSRVRRSSARAVGGGGYRGKNRWAPVSRDDRPSPFTGFLFRVLIPQKSDQFPIPMILSRKNSTLIKMTVQNAVTTIASHT